MSAVEHPSELAGAMPVTGRPRSTLLQLFLRAVRRWQRSRAINQLAQLDDRQLEDIGIARNDIPRVAERLVGLDKHDAEPRRRVSSPGEERTSVQAAADTVG